MRVLVAAGAPANFMKVAPVRAALRRAGHQGVLVHTRPVRMTEGTSRLAPWPLSAGGVLDPFRAAVAEPRALPGSRSPERWDGVPRSGSWR